MDTLKRLADHARHSDASNWYKLEASRDVSLTCRTDKVGFQKCVTGTVCLY